MKHVTLFLIGLLCACMTSPMGAQETLRVQIAACDADACHLLLSASHAGEYAVLRGTTILAAGVTDNMGDATIALPRSVWRPGQPLTLLYSTVATENSFALGATTRRDVAPTVLYLPVIP